MFNPYLAKLIKFNLTDVFQPPTNRSSGTVFENGQTRCEVYASAVPVNAYVNGIGAVAKGFGDDQMQAFQRTVAELFLIAQQLGLHLDSMSFQTPLQSFVR